MKGNKRKKAFISFYLFFRIGTFQWVTADSNKKLLVLFRLRDVLSARLAQTLFPILFRPPPGAAHPNRPTETYNTIFCFCKENAGLRSQYFCVMAGLDPAIHENAAASL
jgi:hypothetical protein